MTSHSEAPVTAPQETPGRPEGTTCGIAHEDVPTLPCTLPRRHEGRHESWGANVLRGWWPQTEREHYYRGWNDCMDWIEKVDAEGGGPCGAETRWRRRTVACVLPAGHAGSHQYDTRPLSALGKATINPPCSKCGGPTEVRTFVSRSTTTGGSTPLELLACQKCGPGLVESLHEHHFHRELPAIEGYRYLACDCGATQMTAERILTPEQLELSRLRSEVHRLHGERETLESVRAWFDAWQECPAALSKYGAITLAEWDAMVDALGSDRAQRSGGRPL